MKTCGIGLCILFISIMFILVCTLIVLKKTDYITKAIVTWVRNIHIIDLTGSFLYLFFLSFLIISFTHSTVIDLKLARSGAAYWKVKVGMAPG